VTDQQLADFLSAPIPRAVPPELRAAALLGPRDATDYAAGLLVLAAGLLASYFMFPWRILDQLALDFGRTEREKGRIVRIEPTNFGIGAQDRRRRGNGGGSVHRIVFSFRPAGRVDEVMGVCYRPPDVRDRWIDRRQSVLVEYVPAAPRISRVVGSRLNVFGYLSVVVIGLPLLGIAILGRHWTIRRDAIQMLSHGFPVTGRVVSVEPRRDLRGRMLQDKTQLTVDFETAEHPGERPVRFYVRGSDAELIKSRLASQQPLTILYDPLQTERMLLVDVLRPGARRDAVTPSHRGP
jgi:hypothetical protein